MLLNFELNENSNTEITLTSLTGSKTLLLYSGNINAGKHLLQIDGSNLSNGVYMLQIKTKNTTTTKKMVVSK